MQAKRLRPLKDRMIDLCIFLACVATLYFVAWAIWKKTFDLGE